MNFIDSIDHIYDNEMYEIKIKKIINLKVKF